MLTATNIYLFIYLFLLIQKKNVTIHANIMEPNNIFKPQDWPSILYKECFRHKIHLIITKIDKKYLKY